MEIFLSGWFWTSIVAPLVLPVIGLMPLKLLPLEAAVAPNLRFISVVKDAQLCWGAVAMGASSFYEYWHAANLPSLAQQPKPPGAGIGFILCLIFLMTLMAMVLAAGGSAFSTPLLMTRAGGLRAWCKHYRAFVGSVALSLTSAIGYTTLHMTLG